MIGRIAELSLAALNLAARAVSTDPQVVAQWLYRFGTVPRTPAIDLDFGPDDDPMAVLGITIGGRVRRHLETVYEVCSLSGWYSFAHAKILSPWTAACKLYISPKPQALTDAFPVIVNELVREEVRSFKVGRGIAGLLRPDKIVAYFENRSHMETTANALERLLRGCPVQGTPFTADIGGNGLLSWGIDPPLGNVAASWRSWITKRLAASLTARHSTVQRNPVTTALIDLRQAGVDTERWMPSIDTFRNESQP